MFRSRTRDRELRLKTITADAEPGFQPRGSPVTSVGIVRRAGASGTRTSRLPLPQQAHSTIPNEVFGSDRRPTLRRSNQYVHRYPRLVTVEIGGARCWRSDRLAPEDGARSQPMEF